MKNKHKQTHHKLNVKSVTKNTKKLIWTMIYYKLNSIRKNSIKSKIMKNIKNKR